MHICWRSVLVGVIPLLPTSYPNWHNINQKDLESLTFIEKVDYCKMKTFNLRYQTRKRAAIQMARNKHPITILRKPIAAVIICMACLLMACGQSPSETVETSSENLGYRQITQSEAMEIMANSDDYILLDVRTQSEFDEVHIPGAICIPNEEIGTEEIPELPDKDQIILVYCRSGRRSKISSEKLAALGYTNVLEFGGIIDWLGDKVYQE